MSISIYQDIILDHYRNPRNFGKMNRPDKSTKVANPLCGDEIELFVIFDKNKFIQAKFIAKGCAISIASASMLSQFIKGKDKNKLLKLDKNFIINMLGIDLSPNRLKCALLPLEAWTAVINS